MGQDLMGLGLCLGLFEEYEQVVEGIRGFGKNALV